MEHQNSNIDRLQYLFISADTFPPFRVDVTELFGEEMTKRGHKIDWLLQSEEQCNKAYVTEWKRSRVFVGSTDTGISRLKRIKKHLLALVHDFKMFRLASSNNYDFIQVKDKFLAAILAIIAAKRNKCKFIFWLSYPFPEASLYEARVGTARYPLLYLMRGYIFKFILYRIIARYADHIFVQSEQMKRDVVSEGIRKDKITPVPMGISLDMLGNLNKIEWKEDNNPKKKIVYLGTMLSTRKLDFLIRVFAIVHKAIPDTILYMIGPEELPDDIKLLRIETDRCNVADDVIFTGRLPREEAFAYVRNANVCVSPFFPTPILNSTSPTKLIEYMALHKPVVANDHPEQSLIIKESNGGISVPYIEKDFAQAIIKILLDPELARDMGNNGYRYVTRYRSYNYLSNLVSEKYRKLCADID